MYFLLKIIFWTGLATVFYAYLGYGILLWLLVRLKRFFGKKTQHHTEKEFVPELTFVVCAFNEAEWIAEKIKNSIALGYPRERVQFYFVTDGSDDSTPHMVEHYPYPPDVRWQLLHQPERRGKIAAFQRAMEQIKTDFVVSTDANTWLNPEALLLMMRHFADPQVGAVAGEKRISLEQKADASSAGEGIYWQYESLLKKWDAELWTVVGAAGELFAFRRAAYEHVPNDTLVEDFYMTMRIAQRGYRVQYEPEAYAAESSSATVSEELKRKVRIAAGGLQALARLAPLLNPFRYGVLTFQYISHRVLRWTLAPLFLPILLIVNILLYQYSGGIYTLFLVAQVFFYIAALIGWCLAQRQIKLKPFFIPYYFCVMNYAMYAGFWRLIRGRQSVVWERARRKGEGFV
jgi:poly-beta-1,6-N-acetyl-D-glucosamine synthase